MLLGLSKPHKTFKESIKALEADIQHANTLASEFSKEYHGACLQMRLSYSPAAHFFLCLVRWMDCSLAGALGLIRILIYKVYRDGTTTLSTHESKASLRDFYAYIYPSLQQLQGGMAEVDTVIFSQNYKKKDDERGDFPTEPEVEQENECGICLEANSKIALPVCNHTMCLKCYRDWHARAQSCPFCRDSLKRVNSRDLWVLTDVAEAEDMATLTKANLQRLFMFVDKLPTLVSADKLYPVYDTTQTNSLSRVFSRLLTCCERATAPQKHSGACCEVFKRDPSQKDTC